MKTTRLAARFATRPRLGKKWRRRRPEGEPTLRFQITLSLGGSRAVCDYAQQHTFRWLCCDEMPAFLYDIDEEKLLVVLDGKESEVSTYWRGIAREVRAFSESLGESFRPELRIEPITEEEALEIFVQRLETAHDASSPGNGITSITMGTDTDPDCPICQAMAALEAKALPG